VYFAGGSILNFQHLPNVAILAIALFGCDLSSDPPKHNVSPETSSQRWEMAETQTEMNEAAAADLADANGELQLALAELRKRAADGGAHAKPAVELLDASQTAWRNFLEAQIAMDFPMGSDVWHGSMEPMCVSLRRTQLVHARVKQLREMIPSDELDVCAPRWPYE
jgi:uncharacterized protein YecT (DUF1311 family)